MHHEWDFVIHVIRDNIYVNLQNQFGKFILVLAASNIMCNNTQDVKDCS